MRRECLQQWLWNTFVEPRMIEADGVNALEPDEDSPRKAPNLPPVHVKHR
jgi:hypothetical protein